ncbi:MAG: zinc-binding dehydrogenase [Suipraeoptans sp.]
MSYQIPEKMKAWVLGDPGVLTLEEKPVPQPEKSEVLVKIDAVAICATDLEIIENGPPALIQGGAPFNKGFTPGHEYMGTVVKLGSGIDEYKVGDRVAVEIHAGCGRCERCREGMYTSCLNYGQNYEGHDKGHRANGFTTDGGFAEYAINNVNTLAHVGDDVSDEVATLIVTAGTAMYGLDALGGLMAGQTLVVSGPGPIGLMAVAVGESLGANPVLLCGTRDNRLEVGQKLGADYTVNVRNENVVEAVNKITNGEGVHYVMECSGAPNAINEASSMVKRGGRICLAAFPSKPVEVEVAALVRNNISMFGIRGEGKSAVHRAASLISEKRFDASLIHTHTFGFEELLTALKYSKERIDDAIKVVVKIPG